MRRRVSKNVSPRGDKGFIIVLAGYGYQLRMSGTAPGWGPKANADVFSTEENAKKVIAELNRYAVYPTIEAL